MHKIVRNDHERKFRSCFVDVEGEAMKSLDKKKLIDRYLQAYNAFDIEGMLAVLAPTVTFENYSGGQLTASASGVDEFRRLAEHSKTMFAEREQRVTGLDHAEECVVADIAYRGRLCMDIPNGPAAGSVLELNGQTEFTFDGDRISKIVDRC